MPTDGDPIVEGLAALAQFFVGEGDLGTTLTRVSLLACEALSADMAGITMLVDGRSTTGVFTDPDVPEMDAEQYRTGSGPCLSAWRTGEAHRIDDTGAECPWPEFAAGAAAHGVMSTLSLPMESTGGRNGALNLYSRRRAAFVRTDLAAAAVWTTAAATVLANALAYAEVRSLTDNLREALSSRATIDQAIGILLASGGCSPEDAFQVLVRASQRENRKLRDIAADLVQGARNRRPAGVLDVGDGS